MKKLFTLSILLLSFIQLFSQTYSSTTVYTPKGTAVEALVLTSGELSSSQKSATKSQTLQAHPNVTFLADATSTYNCHGYAWHIREVLTPIVWINHVDGSWNPNVYKYWTDGSYIEVCSESEADKVHYYSGDHSAITSMVSGKYESKWGSGIRVRHDPTDVPSIYNGSVRRYYSSTKIEGDLFGLCGSRPFSVKNMSGATYSWTFSSGISAVGSTTQSSLTVQRNGNNDGSNWVEVQISTSCASAPVTTRVDFPVGYTYIAATVGGPDNAFPNAGYYFSFTTNPWNIQVTNINWRVPSGWTIVTGQGTAYTQIWTGNSTGVVEVDYDDLCGITHGAFKTVVIGDGGDIPLRVNPDDKVQTNLVTRINVFPNPASEVITVSLSGISAKMTNHFIKQIRITNKMGLVVRNSIYIDKAKSKQINIALLPTDVYTLQVYNNKEWQTIKFIKK